MQLEEWISLPAGELSLVSNNITQKGLHHTKETLSFTNRSGGLMRECSSTCHSLPLHVPQETLESTEGPKAHKHEHRLTRMFLFPLTKSWKASVTCSWVWVFLKSLFTVPSSFCRRQREEELIVPVKKRSEAQSQRQFYTRAHVWYICAKTNLWLS